MKEETRRQLLIKRRPLLQRMEWYRREVLKINKKLQGKQTEANTE